MKSVANYGERVTVTLSPADRHSLQNISSSDVTLSGDGNTRTFVMPARNVTLDVAFQQDYHVVITVGSSSNETFSYYGYSTLKTKFSFGSIDRIPYWNNSGEYLTSLMSKFFTGSLQFINDSSTTKSPSGLSAMVVNGKSLKKGSGGFQSANTPPSLFGASVKGKEVRIKFDPPPTGYL